MAIESQRLIDITNLKRYVIKSDGTSQLSVGYGATGAAMLLSADIVTGTLLASAAHAQHSPSRRYARA